MSSVYSGYNVEAKESYERLIATTNSIKPKEETYKVIINFNNAEELFKFILVNKHLSFTVEKK